MKIKKKSYTVLFTVISSAVALIATVAAITAYNASTITYDIGKTSSRTVFVGDFDRSGVAFEDSGIFADAYKDMVYDITRMCVIRNQMETDGAYDANKEIDIYQYANRYKDTFVSDAYMDMGSMQVKAADSQGESSYKLSYKLDDLIKWGNYGFDLMPVMGTQAQLDAYFYSIINDVSMGDVATENETIHYSSGDAVWLFDEENEMEGEEGIYTEYILVERYKPVGGKSLIDCVSNRREYRNLIRNLCISACDLFNNYSEYVEYLDVYGNGSANMTNIMYCYQMNDADGRSVRYSNLPQDVKRMSNDELSRLFSGQVKYICYNPDRLQTATNIDGVTSVFMKDMIGTYNYSFAEGSRVWLGFDGEYKADDGFAELKNEYNKTGALFVPACVMGISALAAYIILLILMTVQAGKVTIIEENGEKYDTLRAAKWDKIPIELYAIIVSCVVGCVIGMLVFAYDTTYPWITKGGITNMIYIIWGALAVVCSAVMVPLYLMLVRKIKCRLMWNGSVIKWCSDRVKKGVVDLYDNGQLAVRMWLPYLVFLALNLVLVLLGVGGIIIAFIMDILVGIWIYKDARIRNDIVAGISRISDGEITHKVDTTGMHGDNLALAGAVNKIGDGISKAVNTSMRDEKMKADLITNVSHDIKTPLTSIINYVDLLKRENIEDEKIRGYVDILDQKSQRLKQLTDDLVEASKISSGNISLNIEKINFVELIHQSVGEFSEKFEEKGLKTMLKLPSEPTYIMADSRGIYRVVENLYNNIYKYALEGTRVYIDMVSQKSGKEGDKGTEIRLLVKNISADPLNISAEELTERFMRGDESRKTEGSGLGLSIAKSLTEAMGGSFDISLDGDLFKVVLTFAAA